MSGVKKRTDVLVPCFARTKKLAKNVGISEILRANLRQNSDHCFSNHRTFWRFQRR